jgi:trans-aconitate 2-methyltransferase
VIVSCGAIHYIHNHIPVLTRFKEALKPSGKILLSFLGEGSNKSFNFVLQELLLDSKWKELNNLSYQFYSPAEYREMLKAVGFSTNNVEIYS